ncbi:type VI secretion protein [Luteibacter rhizovicinus DSM 16549]|uniref:Type VI secretion protein n=1 Tax=Luteibacter rhizovicinus DSM 16549 TaxID=1440763 RepID=A0A1L3EV40_9GAMM|nr:type IV secretion system protein [Luteibacter rhizovicinus]APG04867.1 type VI secretion protein [Luteibacter rhizovicinus DSM 16549]
MPNIADYVYYRLVYDYLNDQIAEFGMDLMKRMMTWASAIALTLVTLWIIVQGFRIATGRSRESLMEVVINMGRIVVVVAAATTMALAGRDLHTFLTTDLDMEIHELFTGNANQTTADSIDQNLAYTQLALSTINSVQVVPGDAEMQVAKDRSTWIATFGTASPPMTAGAMLLLYQFAIALFIGLGPLFILCLIFEQTKDLFKRWLMYGVGTIFSMALLSVVASMVLGLTIRVSAALWGAKIINSIMGNSTEGLTSVAMQQGGIGLLLSILVVSVPPMAAMFFQGTLGNALTYSVFQGAGSRPGPQGQPAGSWSERSLPPPDQQHSRQQPTHDALGGFANRVSIPQGPAQQESVKQGAPRYTP